MQTRHSHFILNIDLLNDINFQRQNFFLFNFLFSSAPNTEYTAGTVYTINDQPFTLTHTLKTTPNKMFTPMQAFLVLNENGVIIGDLHLLSIGIIYFHQYAQPSIALNGLRTKLEMLILKMRLTFENIKADTPLSRELAFLEARIKKITPEALSCYYLFTYFYDVRLNAATQWKTMNVVLESPKAISYHLHCFLHSTADTHLFLHHENYYFQNYAIQFEYTMVRRQRKKAPYAGFDMLWHESLGTGKTSDVYPVIALYVENNDKCALKHPYVYKISRAQSLKKEFEEAKDVAHLSKARNYHPELYSLPYFGEDFVSFYEKTIFDKPPQELIYQFLKYTAKVFYAIDQQLKNIIHGDIKPNNICVDADGEVWLIDYHRANQFTYHYAAPELLSCKKNLTCAVDVYSAARMIVELWGDPHVIWNYEQEDAKLIINLVCVEKSKLLLLPFFEAMSQHYTEADFPRNILEQYLKILRQCHYRTPERRPTALEAAEAFQTVFKAYEAYLADLAAPVEESYINRRHSI